MRFPSGFGWVGFIFLNLRFFKIFFFPYFFYLVFIVRGDKDLFEYVINY